MRRTLLSVLSICLLAAASLHATVLLPIEFRELVQSAQAIVHGRVVDVRSEWVDGRRAVETFVTIEAAEYLKGGLGERVTFKIPGGQLGRYRTVFVGAPTFAEGDEVVLFLRANGPSFPFIIGLTQGLFRVNASAGTGEAVVTPPVLLGKSGVESETIVRGDPARKTLPMSSFRSLVRQVIDEAARGAAR
jgi:hypothetical protein